MVYLHEQNVVHRDLKTSNVLVFPAASSNSQMLIAKLCDFGGAKDMKPAGEETTQTGSRFGT